MTESNRTSRLLEHVVVQAPDSPHPNSSRVDVAIEMQDLYGGSPPPQVKKERVRRRRKPKPYTIKFYQRMLRRLMRSKEWTYLMIIVIVYVLFVDDIVAMTKAFKGNGLFLGVGISKMVVLGLFVLEFFMQLFAMRREYNYKSLFFWLDIIAIGSLIPDVLILAYGDDTSVGINELAIARAGRAARASGRVARILRISQFYTCFGWSRKKKDEERERSDSEPVVPIEPSRMGNRLINRTTNKVVVIVLVLMFVSSFMQGELDATPFVRAGLAELETVHDLGDPAASIYASITERYIASQPDIIFLQIRGEVLHEDKRKIDGIFPHSLLKYKSSKSEAAAANSVRSEAWYDNRDESAKIAGFNMGMLLLVLVLLTVGNLLIIRDATKLVITPMERVLAVLKQLSADRRKDRINRSGSGSGGGPSRKNRQSKDYTDTSDDMTSNSGMEDDEDEAEALFGMLNDIDGNLQAARERAELEAGENQRLRYRIMDLVAEKKLAELQISGIKRRSRPAKVVENPEGAESSDPSNGIVDQVEGYVISNRNMSRVATASRKVDFGLNIGGRKFMTHAENDAPDIKFSHTPTTSPNPTPPPSPNASQLRDRNSDLEHTTSVSSVTLGGIGPVASKVEMPQVQVATIDRLIERLTYEEYTDAKFIHVFLLTYRSLLSPFELMERLLVRFCYVTPDVLLPKDSSQETIEEWRRQKQAPVRIGVYNALKLWIGRYFWDFHENKELVDMLSDFMEYLLPEMNMDRHAINIETLFKAKSDEDRNRREQLYTVPIPPTPEEMTVMCTGDSELNKYEIIDLAKQITLVEHDLFRAIRPNELLNQAWTKKNKERDSPNILRLIDHFNNISAWIKTQVVKSNKVKERGQAMKRAIMLSEELVKLNNFNGAMEVLAALSNASISRLKKTWAVIPTSSQESFQELGNLMSAQSSFKVYRERLHTAQQPAIPYIGVYLSDLVFIDEGNPDTVESPLPSALINFDKHRQVAAVVSEIQKYQSISYLSSNNNNNNKNNNNNNNNKNEESDDEEEGLQRKPEIIEFIAQLNGIDDDTAYKTSLIAEPRARAGSSGIPLSPNPSLLQRLRNASPSGTL